MEDSATSSSADISRPWQSYHTVYTNAKAGMDGVDKEKVQRIVYEMSKGSKYFENEERKEAVIRQKIERMRARCAKLSASDISYYQAVAEKRIVQLEATRDLSRIWLHVDMDAFYAAVETLCNPSLKGKPMAVGSMSMISTANYEARKFGVRAAMPGFIARRLCPDLIFVPVDFKTYTHYSDLTRKVFEKYDANYTAASLDEAYLDITSICKEQDRTGEEIAEELRTRVYEETGLTCSTGVAPNRLLAKVCSDINKPNGQFVLPNNRKAVMTFISSLPIRKIGGIGKVTENILKDVFGINTCEEILQKSAFLCALFSSSTADFFLSVGLGIGGTDTPEARSRKSISNERTFSPTEDKTLIYKKLAELAELLATDMQKEGLSGKTLTLKLKTASFEVRTRAVTLQTYISSSEEVLKHASKLMKAELPVSLRLIGLRMSQFNEEKVIAPDPTQKTITNFIVPLEANKKNGVDQSDSVSEHNDSSFMCDIETSSCAGIYETAHHDLIDPSESRNLLVLDQGNGSLSNSAGELKNENDSLSVEVANKDTPGMLDHSRGSCNTGGPQLPEAECSSGQCHSSNVDKPRANIPEDEAVPLSNQERSLWIDDYKCSICGLELPPSFVEERQEHSDFHLAERLQREESGTSSSSVMLRPRCVQKEHSARQSSRKKLKPSPKVTKHIPIDLFFVKNKQNS